MNRNHAPRSQRLGKAQRWSGIVGVCLLLWLSACTSAPAQSQRPANLGPTPTPDFQLHNTAITTRQTLVAYAQLIAQAQTYGHDVSLDQQQLAQDDQDFDSAHTVQAYQALTARIQAQMSRLRKAMLPEKTRYDLHQLQKMIGQTDINNDYEYRDADDALLALQGRLQWAKTTSDYQQIDDQAQILLTNLRALLANLNDKTPHKQAHATDLQLIDAYHLTGKVIIVSLTEQTLRMYTNGKLVGWMFVVTGQRAMQTPPGLWHILTKETNLTFSAPPTEDPNSPLWYPPTHINYGLKFKEWSYYLHDATWRSYFGPGANLPHDDYTSGKYSVNGTHGCINMNLNDTRRLYNWAEVGIPVVVY